VDDWIGHTGHDSKLDRFCINMLNPCFLWNAYKISTLRAIYKCKCMARLEEQILILCNCLCNVFKIHGSIAEVDAFNALEM
jgi:hypothetical protein